jgi:hypothetical protein
MMGDTGCSATLAVVAKREFLRLCALRFLTNEALSPNILADEFWHIFLLHTKAYREFCLRHFLKFIDHEPATTARNNQPSFETGEHLYEDCFGDEPAASRDTSYRLVFYPTLADRIAAVRSEIGNSASPPFMGQRFTERADGQASAPLTETFHKWGNWDNSWVNWGNERTWSKWFNCS